MNAANLAAATNFLKTVGMAVDPASTRGVQVSISEAKKIAEAYDQIPDAATKKAVGSALLKLIQSDVFEVPSQGARDLIAKVVGQPADQVFSARDRASLVGGASVKSVAQAALGMLAKAPNLDKASMEKLQKGLDAMPKEVQRFVNAVLKNSAAAGEVKMQPDARTQFTRGYAKLDGESGGSVNKMADALQTPAPGNLAFFAATMGNSPYIEDRIAALMFLVCSKQMEEVDRDLKSLDNTVKADQKKADIKKADKPSSSSAAAGVPAAQATSANGAGPSRVQQVRTQYEGLVQSVAAHRADDGVIDRTEAAAIAKKLGTLDPDARQLQATAMGRALVAAGGGDVLPEAEPLANWVKSELGITDLRQIPGANEAFTSKEPLAQAIGGADKLENKVAAAIVDGIFGNKGEKMPALQKTMNEYKPLFAAMEQQLTGTTAEAARATAPKATATQAQGGTDLVARFGRIADAVKDGKIPSKDLASVGAKLAERLPGFEGAGKNALVQGITKGLQAVAAGQPPHLAIAASVTPLVSHCLGGAASKASAKATGEKATTAPDVSATLGASLDGVRDRVSSSVAHASDAGTPLSAADKGKLLDDTLAQAKGQLLGEAKQAGYDQPQLDALGAAFDSQAGGLRAEMSRSGTLATSTGGGRDALDPTMSDDGRSRQIMFERLKLKMTQLSEMMQAMSNVLNTMHQTAENAIRAIR